MKIPALAVALALSCGASAFAANSSHDRNSPSGKATAHQVASDLEGALHRIGAATKHAIRRADAALHHVAHRAGNTNA